MSAGVERFSLTGRTCLVTGAAGQLGTAYSAALEEAGASVIRADLNPGGGMEQVDVADEASVRELFGRVSQRTERLDVLVNNAGIGVYTPLEDRTVEELMRVEAVNLTGTALMTRAALDLVPDGGSVINVGSIYGMVAPDPRIYGESGRNSSEIYGATKAGVIQMTKWFAIHCAPRRIRVNAITPGGVWANQTEDFVRAYEQRTPLGRMATPDDLTGALVYLASDASAYMTGQNLAVDGGWTAW